MTDKYFSKRSKKIYPQPMFSIMSRATKLEKTQKRKIIHLEIGNTGYFKNDLFLKYLNKETNFKNIHYVSSAGIYDTRNKIAKKLSQNNNNFTHENIIISSANSLITMFLYSLVNEGEKILILRPYFPTYQLSSQALGLKINYYDLNEDNDWQISPDKFLEIYKNKKFKAVILNSPSNPSGKLIENSNLKKILKICEEKKVFCLIDYTYHNLLFDKKQKPKIFFNNFSFYIFSYSKDAAIPTFRLGFGLANKKIINKIQEMNSLIYSCYPANIQKALIKYLPHEKKFLKKINYSLLLRKNLAIKILQKSNKFEIVNPDGGIYILIKILDKIDGDDFSKILLEKHNVCVCPGSSFGSNFKQYFRINLAGKFFELKMGLNKIVSFFN